MLLDQGVETEELAKYLDEIRNKYKIPLIYQFFNEQIIRPVIVFMPQPTAKAKYRVVQI